MYRTVYRLIAILLMLWLPLQAVASAGAPVCARGHGNATQELSAPDVTTAGASDGGLHLQHGLAAGDGRASQDLIPDDDGGPPGSPAPQCGGCLMGCAASVQVHVVECVPLNLGRGAAWHGDEAFVSAATDRALEPPIAAA